MSEELNIRTLAESLADLGDEENLGQLVWAELVVLFEEKIIQYMDSIK